MTKRRSNKIAAIDLGEVQQLLRWNHNKKKIACNLNINRATLDSLIEENKLQTKLDVSDDELIKMVAHVCSGHRKVC